MADGRRRDAWNHTASLLAMLFNVNARRSDRLPPAAFHPLAEPAARRATPAPIWALKALLPAGAGDYVYHPPRPDAPPAPE